MRRYSKAILAWKPSGRYTTAFPMRPVAEMVADVDAVMPDDDYSLPLDEDYILRREIGFEAFVRA